MTGTTIAQAVPIAISPILTRMYTPEDFGIFAIYMSLSSILAIFATGRYELAVMLPKNKKEAMNIVALSFFITIIISICLFMVILLFHNELVLLIGTLEVSNWLYVMPLSIMLVGFYQSLNYWNNRNKKYKLMAKSKIYQSISTGSANISFGLLLFSKSGLIIGQLIGQFVALLILGKNFVKNDSKYLKNINRIKIYVLLKKYRDFPKINMPHAFLNTLSSNLPILIIGKFFDSASVGFYSLANLIIVGPMGIITSAYSQVFMQQVSELKHNKTNEISFLKTTIVKLLLYAFPIFFTVFFFIEDIVTIVFGDKWLIAGTYSMILIPMLYFRFVGSIVSSIPIIYNQQGKALFLEILNVLLRFISLWIGALNNDVFLALVLFSISSSIITIYRLNWYVGIVMRETND